MINLVSNDTKKGFEMEKGNGMSNYWILEYIDKNIDLDSIMLIDPKSERNKLVSSDIVMRSDKMTRTNINEIKIEQSTNWNNTQDIYNFRIGNDFSFELIKLKDKNGFRYRTPNDCIRAKAFEAIFNVDNLTTNEFFTNYIEREAK